MSSVLQAVEELTIYILIVMYDNNHLYVLEFALGNM